MSKRLAAIFPGQGSQNVGMGVDIAERSPQARRLFDVAAGVLGYDLLALQKNGPEERLRETQVSQPAIFVTNVALFAALGDAARDVGISAGHSFGEICSLYAAGAIDFDAAVHVVNERAQAMQRAAQLAPGGMTAVLGLDESAIRGVIERVAADTSTRIQLANFNSPTQIVVSGDISGVRAAGDALLAAGAKRVVPLNVSGAWHSVLMEPAVERFRAAVERASFRIPRFDVVSNVDAMPYRDVRAIRTNLVASITHEVLWHACATRLLENRPDVVVEFGASAVLGPLMKRMPGAPDVALASDFSSVQKIAAAVEAVQA